MSKVYNNRLFSMTRQLQNDLKNKLITEEEFKFLLGFLFQTEVDKFVKQEIASMMPEEDGSLNKMTLISYEVNRKLSHA